MRGMKKLTRGFLVLVLLGVAQIASAQTGLTADQAAKVESAIRDVMSRTAVPSVSVGIALDGRIVYTRAFGKAKIEPPVDATPGMLYAIGSISKQFTAACILLLQEEGRLSIDDPVGKYFPELTRANEVTIKNILSHTSGYRDYAPQDYTIPAWTKPTTAQKIVHEWATQPLDFDPGTQYQYSNTNYNIAGLIVEKVSGEPFWSFLTRRILAPLGMKETIDLDAGHDKVVPIGYMRNALGPLRPAIIEAPGWYFADGEIAMSVGDLLTWDISIIQQSVLKPASYALMETDVRLKNGDPAHYGLGLTVATRDGHRVVSHGGEVGGFVASNTVLPDDKVAIAVLTNQEASPAAGGIGRALSNLLVESLPAADTARARAEAQTRRVLGDFQQGRIDRSLFTDNCNFYFDKVALDDYRASLAPLGPVKDVTQASTTLRGGMTFRTFDVTFGNGTRVRVMTYTTRDGKLDQFLVEPVA
jgi:CubicO group peptidase (beta-lactamase class C family)